MLLPPQVGCDRDGAADPVILALGDEVARRSEFEKHLRELSSRGGAPVSPDARDGLLEAWLERRALVMEARTQGLLAPGAPPDEEEDATRRLLAQNASVPEVTPAEVEAAYRANPQQCSTAETVTLRQVLVPTLAQARDVLRRLRKDPRAFAAMAQTLSRGPEASGGGFMGRFERGQLPSELDGPAFAVPPGQTSDIIQTPLGYHVLRVEERTPERQQGLEECGPQLEADLAAQRSERRVREYVAGLMARAKVNHEAAKNRNPPS